MFYNIRPGHQLGLAWSPKDWAGAMQRFGPHDLPGQGLHCGHQSQELLSCWRRFQGRLSCLRLTHDCMLKTALCKLLQILPIIVEILCYGSHLLAGGWIYQHWWPHNSHKCWSGIKIIFLIMHFTLHNSIKHFAAYILHCTILSSILIGC